MTIEKDIIVYDNNKASYKVLDFFKSGGFGHLYKIEKNDDNSIWILKTLSIAFQDAERLQALINEGHLATKIRHQNVIQYIFFHDGNLFKELPHYIIMEYADQGTLKELLQQQEQCFRNDELNNFFNQLIDGMEAINSKLIHRDIKPDNVLIKDSLLKISDFGLSKVIEEQTRTHTFKGIGHMRYMAPEGWNNDKNTIQMDIYSMGIVFYELATLHHPFEDTEDDIQKLREAHLFQNPRTPETINAQLTPILSQLILRMFEKSTTKRFKTWSEIRSELAKEDLPRTANTHMIDAILKKRVEKDREIEEARLKAEKRQAEIDEFNKFVKYQFERDVLEPLRDFIEEFNKRCSKGSIHIGPNNSDTNYMISLPSGSSLVLDIQILTDEGPYQETLHVYRKRLRGWESGRPLLGNRKILAWGYLKSDKGKGFNIVLLEKDGDLYGDWFVLINTNSAFNTYDRRYPEPFPFEYGEIEKEIHNIRAVHIYNTEVASLGIEHFAKVIEECI